LLSLFRQGSPQKDKTSGSHSSRGGEASSSSFRDYWESVNDAWDCADDEFTNLAGKIYLKISSKVQL